MHFLIAWFARNPIAANLLMIAILFLGGFSVVKLIPLEVFPNVESDVIDVTVTHPGSSPEEVEKAITVLIEEAVYDLQGIKTISSRSSEGLGQVFVELESGVNKRDLLSDVQGRIDAISEFPEDADRPTVSISQFKHEVIAVVVSGTQSEKELRIIAERVRDDLSKLPGVTQVFLDSVREVELSIEIPNSVLKEYDLSLDMVAAEIRAYSLDLSAGTLKSQAGELFIRSRGQAYSIDEFRQIPIRSLGDGRVLRLGDIAQMKDGFEETPVKVRFNNEQAIQIEVYRVGKQSAITVANEVKNYIERARSSLPEGAKIDYWRDRSRIVKARLSTLMNSAIQGGLLVLILLALFLRPAVAFWVCVGIPISFMGGLFVMPFLDVTLNIFSLFAFILVLGIVVDDAIVTGESIYTHLRRGDHSLSTVIKGAQEVSIPVTFGVLTTIAAFVPLALVEGDRSILFLQIPLVVIPVLLFSLVESKFILPAHLRHLKPLSDQPEAQGWFSRLQQSLADGLEKAILHYYKPCLVVALEYRYLVLTVFFALGMILITLISSGWMKFVFFPRVESEIARAYLTMPTGTAFEITDDYIEKMTKAALVLQDKYRDAEGHSVINNIMSTSGHAGGTGRGSANRGRVFFEIDSPEVRTVNIRSTELVAEWRELIGELPGVESLTFRAEIGRTSDPIDIQLQGQDPKQLRLLADDLKKELEVYPHVFDITDNSSEGKKEVLIELKPLAKRLGLNLSTITRQVRHAVWGLEVQRVQRGREDLAVFLRNPLEERIDVSQLEALSIRLPSGGSVPFSDVASLTFDSGVNTIIRENRERTLSVWADVNKELVDMGALKRSLTLFLDGALSQYPGVSYEIAGEAKEQEDSFQSLSWGFLGLLLSIYALLAIPFKSYLQPFIVLSVIPFGMIGAVLGHSIMAMDLTLLSLMGMLALSGVVVNDSLVLVDYINRQQQNKDALEQAISTAASARFRPVILTSLTTFAGLMPLMFEQSTQAQFLIPMAVSLGFGIVFATLVTLFLVPINYLILEDFKGLGRRLKMLII